MVPSHGSTGKVAKKSLGEAWQAERQLEGAGYALSNYTP